MVAHTGSPSIWDWETEAGAPTADLMLASVYSESDLKTQKWGRKESRKKKG